MNKLTNFFSNKKFLIGSEPPTQGKFEVGDLIVNTGSGAASTPMWICYNAGEPGEWSPVGVGSKYTTEKSLMVVSNAVSEVEIGIEFDKRYDTLLVFINDAYMTEDTDYLLEGNKIKVIGDEAWNENLTNDFTFEFVVFKSIADLAESNIVISPEQIEDGSITLDKLEQSFSDVLNNIEPLDLTPYQQITSNDLITNNKTIVGAINELFQNANNGKELIANAIGEPLNAEDTFSAMSDKINVMKSDLKQVLIDKGVNVTEEDDMNSLINKVDEKLNNTTPLVLNSQQTGPEITLLSMSGIKGVSTTWTRILDYTYEFKVPGTYKISFDHRSSGNNTSYVRIVLVDANDNVLYTSAESTTMSSSEVTVDTHVEVTQPCNVYLEAKSSNSIYSSYAGDLAVKTNVIF